MTLRFVAGLALSLVVCLVGLLVVEHIAPKSAAAPTDPVPTCVPSPNIACPDASWIRDYHDWQVRSKEFNADLDKMNNSEAAKKLRDEQLYMKGLEQTLNQRVPPGYSFNSQSETFVKQAPPPPPGVPAPPKK